MKKFPKTIKRGVFKEGPKEYKDFIYFARKGLRKNLTSQANKLVTKRVNEELDRISSVKVTDHYVSSIDKNGNEIQRFNA